MNLEIPSTVVAIVPAIRLLDNPEDLPMTTGISHCVLPIYRSVTMFDGFCVNLPRMIYFSKKFSVGL